VTQEEQQDTHESAAVEPAEAVVGPEGVEAIGDPAAASVDADVGPDPVAFMPPSAEAGDPGGQSPAEADRRAESAPSPPFAAFGGAFVGGFVAAKLIGMLGGGDD
jgi:hypothetical protein